MDEENMIRKAFFNKRAHTWLDKFYKDPETGTHDRYAEKINKIVASLDIEPDDRVLDVGCGSGVLVPYILNRLSPKGRLFEVDYAENMITANKKEHHDKRITFVCSDVMGMPFEPFLFDSIICFACFPHFQDQEKALSKLAGLLKTKGLLTIAHLLSSKEIKDHHNGKTAVSRDRLPVRQKMEGFCEDCGLGIRGFKDEPGKYILSVKKE
ncbi:MAG: methyltransferase domain-containing protein [Desulfobacterium sp.]